MEGGTRDGLLQVRDQGAGVEGLAADVAVHEVLVLALGDDALDQPLAGLVDQRDPVGVGFVLGALAGGVVEELLGEQSDQSGHRGLPVGAGGAAQREVEGEDGVGVVAAEGLGAQPGHLLHAGAGRLEVGDDDGAGHADGRALVPHRPGGAVHAVRGGDHEEGRVRRAQTGPELSDEVGVAGGVQQIDLDPVPCERDQGELYRAVPPLLDLVVVGDGAAVLDPARPVDRPRGLGQGLHQRGLSRSGGADQHHVADGGGPVGRRRPAGGPGVVTVPVAHDPALPCTVSGCRRRWTPPAGADARSRGPQRRRPARARGSLRALHRRPDSSIRGNGRGA